METETPAEPAPHVCQFVFTVITLQTIALGGVRETVSFATSFNDFCNIFHRLYFAHHIDLCCRAYQRAIFIY
jgi:hypothetical protein